jgi:hypothetical protein
VTATPRRRAPYSWATTLALAVVLPWAGFAASLPVPTPPPISSRDAPPFAAWLAFEHVTPSQRGDFENFFVDALLAHQVFQFPPTGLPAPQARELLLDDDTLLLSSGRRLWNKELLHQPGLAGKFCYLHSSLCWRRLLEVRFAIDDRPVVIYDNQYRILRMPSHTLVEYHLDPVRVEEYKFITIDDRAAVSYRIRSTDGRAHRVTLDLLSQHLPMPQARPDAALPLLGSGTYQSLPIFAYLDAPQFAVVDATAVQLRRSIDLPADGSVVEAQAAVSFDTRTRSAASYSLPPDLFARHQREYNDWFARNVPYFDAADAGFKVMWYYRWWIVRFNMAEADTPDLHGYRFYEGKLGFDNQISFAVPAQLKDLTYLRDPSFGRDQVRNAYANLSPVGAVVDPPGSPYWGEMYSHWIAAALAEFERVHPLPATDLAPLVQAAARDVRAWMTTFDPDGDGLPQRNIPRITGYDLDILSFWYFCGLRLDLSVQPPDMERVDFASFVYANATAVAELARTLNDTALAADFDALAERIRAAVLGSLWDDRTHFFYPQRAGDGARAWVRELHGFFPFTTGLAPDEPRYVAALDKFIDPNEFWARFPPVITSIEHYKRWTWEMDGLTRNIAPHPISMGARTLIEALKHYHGHHITPAHFMELMRRYNALVYPGVNPFDPYWRPNAHEYYSKWEPYQATLRPKPSDISHDFHSMYTSLIVEGVVGLTPRTDDKIELQPAALEWPYFALAGLRYRGHDLTIIWDHPDGEVRYAGQPEGFSLAVDGKRVFTRPQLGHVIYDPATNTTQTLETAAVPTPTS